MNDKSVGVFRQASRGKPHPAYSPRPPPDRPLRLLILAVLAVAGCSQARPPEAPPDIPTGNATGRTAMPPGVAVVSREAWGGAAPTRPMTPQTPRRLTIHHSATPQKPGESAGEILRPLLRFSLSSDTLGDGRPKQPWADVPYHFLIGPDGSIGEGRDVRFRGDSNTAYSLDGHLQVVVQGNFMEETPTPEQMASVTALAAALTRQWRLDPADLAGHRDHAVGQTSCPGDALEARFPEIRAAMEAASEGSRGSVQ